MSKIDRQVLTQEMDYRIARLMYQMLFSLQNGSGL